ncbi:MAG: sulfatase [Deltaproteobacteria bacterium]|jgi:arylsulfatase A-like enzyme|nr:sulfatase [Deltaproteobacteria bacterium]
MGEPARARLGVLSVLSLGALFGCGSDERSSAPEPVKQPNIVLIFVDDLGYADLGIHGSEEILTPNIDQLAREGARLTQGYVSAPQCSPARAGILTGRSQSRFGFEMNVPPGYSVSAQELLDGKPLPGMPVSERTIAQRLKAAGYATGAIGKWHLGEEEEFHPMSRGFDEFYGFLRGGSRYLPSRRTPAVERDGVKEVCREYLTDAFSHEAASFIERHNEEPFFLYLAYNCPHTPMEAKPDELKRFSAIKDETRRTLAAMMSSMDQGVGEVMDALSSSGIDDETLVFFISDNGGQTNKNGSLNDPFSGKKGDLLEGGIRVPFFARWPGVIKAGATLEHPVTALDFAPTALALAGADEASGMDGVDLSGYLSGQTKELAERVLYWRFGEQRALRRGPWKYYGYMGEIELLFNLDEDPREERNVARDHPSVFDELRGLHAAWEAELVEPLWDVPMNTSVRAKALKQRYRLGTAGPR